MSRPPDVVLIVTDQQRFDQVGYVDDDQFDTPNIDALAARGVVFDRAYSAATTCVPARVPPGVEPEDWAPHFGPGRFPYPHEAHPTGWVEREAVEVLRSRDRDRPLLLVVSFPHPHAPYNPPEPYASMYEPITTVLPEDGFARNLRLRGRCCRPSLGTTTSATRSGRATGLAPATCSPRSGR